VLIPVILAYNAYGYWLYPITAGWRPNRLPITRLGDDQAS